MAKPKHNPLLERLKYHVTGAIERGEATAITAVVDVSEAELDAEEELLEKPQPTPEQVKAAGELLAALVFDN